MNKIEIKFNLINDDYPYKVVVNDTLFSVHNTKDGAMNTVRAIQHMVGKGQPIGTETTIWSVEMD